MSLQWKLTVFTPQTYWGLKLTICEEQWKLTFMNLHLLEIGPRLETTFICVPVIFDRELSDFSPGPEMMK